MESQIIDGVRVFFTVSSQELQSRQKYTFICEIHGPFVKEAGLIINKKTGCPKCGRLRAGKINSVKRKINAEHFFEDCARIHNSKYSYDGIEYEHSLSKLRIWCPSHEVFFEVRADRHKKGQGCQLCSHQKSSERKTLSFEEWINRCRSSHHIEYDYSEVNYTNTTAKVTIICPSHGRFLQEASHHMRGSDCPKCRGRISKRGEEWLKIMKVPIREQFLIETRTWADGFDPNTKTIFLFHGDYWHGNPAVYPADMINPTTKTPFGELYSRTIEMTERYLSYGYDVVTMWESDFIKDPSTPSSYQRGFR